MGHSLVSMFLVTFLPGKGKESPIEAAPRARQGGTRPCPEKPLTGQGGGGGWAPSTTSPPPLCLPLLSEGKADEGPFLGVPCLAWQAWASIH